MFRRIFHKTFIMIPAIPHKYEHRDVT